MVSGTRWNFCCSFFRPGSVTACRTATGSTIKPVATRAGVNVEDTPHTGAPGPDLSLAGARFATMLESQAATGLGMKPCLVSILIQRGAFLATLSAS